MSKSKILITGADGFIGSHLTELLLKKDFEVKAFCFYNSNGSWGWLETLPNEVKNNIEVVLGDIRDFQCVKESMKDCDFVFHLASLISIPYSYIASSSYVQTNIQGTLNVVQAATDLQIKRIIHTSTSETYGTAQFVPINEKHPLVGQSPYAASKIGADQLALSFWHSFQTPVSIIRPFNTYGPRQSCRAVIPTIITQINKGSDEIKLGSISPTRDFNFVLDTCNAYLAILKSEKTIGKVINSASNFEISIGETANLISQIMNRKINIVSDNQRMRPKESEVDRLYGDNTLLKQLTDWAPQFTGLEGFKKGLKLTIDWFKEENNISFYKNSNYMI